MGTTPCGGTEHNLDFLPTRQTSHCIVRDEFGFKAKVRHMFLNLATNEGTEKTKALSFTCINLNDFLQVNKATSESTPTNHEKETNLLKATLYKIVPWHPDVLR
jgi:hypothetical protein